MSRSCPETLPYSEREWLRVVSVVSSSRKKWFPLRILCIWGKTACYLMCKLQPAIRLVLAGLAFALGWRAPCLPDHQYSPAELGHSLEKQPGEYSGSTTGCHWAKPEAWMCPQLKWVILLSMIAIVLCTLFLKFFNLEYFFAYYQCLGKSLWKREDQKGTPV